MTVCLACGWKAVGPVDLNEHFDRGLCRRRTERVAGEIVEGRDGRFRIVRAQR